MGTGPGVYFFRYTHLTNTHWRNVFLFLLLRFFFLFHWFRPVVCFFLCCVALGRWLDTRG